MTRSDETNEEKLQVKNVKTGNKEEANEKKRIRELEKTRKYKMKRLRRRQK